LEFGAGFPGGMKDFIWGTASRVFFTGQVAHLAGKQTGGIWCGSNPSMMLIGRDTALASDACPEKGLRVKRFPGFDDFCLTR